MLTKEPSINIYKQQSVKKRSYRWKCKVVYTNTKGKSRKTRES